MALYKVNRRIVHDHEAFNPGSTIELTDRQAAQMKNGQVSLIPEVASKPPISAPKPTPLPVRPTATILPQVSKTKPVIEAQAAGTETDSITAPAK